jgi:hypothetical protein
MCRFRSAPKTSCPCLVGGSGQLRQHRLIRHRQRPTRNAPLVRVALTSKREAPLRKRRTIAPERFGLDRSGGDRRSRVRHGEQPAPTNARRAPLTLEPKTAYFSEAKTNMCPPVRRSPSRQPHPSVALQCPDPVSLPGTYESHPAPAEGPLEKTPLPFSHLRLASTPTLRVWPMESSPIARPTLHNEMQHFSGCLFRQRTGH